MSEKKEPTTPESERRWAEIIEKLPTVKEARAAGAVFHLPEPTDPRKGCRTIMSGAVVAIECDLELGAAVRYCENARAEWETERDREHEAKLARMELRGDTSCPWPWYADEPGEVQEPAAISPLRFSKS